MTMSKLNLAEHCIINVEHVTADSANATDILNQASPVVLLLTSTDPLLALLVFI